MINAAIAPASCPVLRFGDCAGDLPWRRSSSSRSSTSWAAWSSTPAPATVDRYRPLEHSRVSASPEPAAVIEGLLALHPFRTLYIADLDAIRKQGDHKALIFGLRRMFPQLQLVGRCRLRRRVRLPPVPGGGAGRSRARQREPGRPAAARPVRRRPAADPVARLPGRPPVGGRGTVRGAGALAGAGDRDDAGPRRRRRRAGPGAVADCAGWRRRSGSMRRAECAARAICARWRHWAVPAPWSRARCTTAG